MDENKIMWEISSAIEDGETARVRDMLAAYPAMIALDTPFGSWLHVAAEFGRTEVIAHLLHLGADINRRGGTDDGAAINVAASDGHLEVVRQLLDAGAELDTSEPERNPLFAAILDGHTEIVQLLIERGIDYRVSYSGESMKNMDAEAFAREQGQTEIADYLATLKASAKPAKS